MKFFSLDLLERLNSLNREVRNKAQLEWENICNQYALEFNHVKGKLQKSLLCRLQNDSFHDATINEIKIFKERNDIIATIYIQKFLINGEKIYSETLSHIGVKSMKYTTCSNTKESKHIGTYLYGEIFQESGLIIHNFILADGCEINISCKKLYLSNC